MDASSISPSRDPPDYGSRTVTRTLLTQPTIARDKECGTTGRWFGGAMASPKVDTATLSDWTVARSHVVPSHRINQVAVPIDLTRIFRSRNRHHARAGAAKTGDVDRVIELCRALLSERGE